jgi:hypothetical protein
MAFVLDLTAVLDTGVLMWVKGDIIIMLIETLAHVSCVGAPATGQLCLPREFVRVDYWRLL